MARQRTKALAFANAADLHLEIERLRNRGYLRDTGRGLELTPTGEAMLQHRRPAGRERRRPGHRAAA